MIRESSVQEGSAERLTRLIFEHAAQVGRSHDLSELIHLNAHFAREIVGADRCSLWLIDETANELWTIVAHGMKEIRIPFGHGLVGVCVRDGEVVLTNDVQHDPRFHSTVDANSGYESRQMLCMPMRGAGRVIGALQLLNKEKGFTERDVNLVELLAHFAASAVESERLRQGAESARLLRHELDLARDVQSRLLPQEGIQTEGVTAVCFCRPAKIVGGDYCDLIPLGEGRLAFTLGDVSGKGIAAAVMMASIQTLLRSLLQQEQMNVARILQELNRVLYESSTASRYSTLFCAVVDTAKRELTYVNAGHVPPLLLKSDGRLITLPGGGLPVGLLPACEYEPMVAHLERGDTLLVVSDGFIEACSMDGTFWDDARVGEIFQQHGLASIAELPGVLTAEADAWAAGAEQFDDMTVVAIRIA